MGSERRASRAAPKADLLCVAVLALLAVAVLHARMRLAVLDPGYVDWMRNGDWPNHFLGWSFYRWDSWRFPIGSFSNLLHPVGTSTGLTDSIPWLALICKILDPWLPRSFQYFGLYLLACFFLQGLIGFRILMLLSRDRLYSMVSAAFLMVAPVLLDRIIHIALCSQWMVLALILWNLSSARSPRSSRLCCRKATALNLLAAVTHPYLWIMTFALSLPLFARAKAAGSPAGEIRTSFALWTSLQLVLVALAWWGFGYLVLGSVEEYGFGIYGGRLAGFFNSAGRTALVPPLPGGQPAGEAFDFLGLGILLVAAILAVAWLKRRLSGARGGSGLPPGPWLPSSPLFPLMLTATGFWFFSLARFAPLFAWLGPLPGAFRASGRFSWPLYYCVVLFLLCRFRRAFPSRAASGVLLLLLALQVYDLQPYWLAQATAPRPIPEVGAARFWRGAGQAFRHLVLWPQGSGERCGRNLFGYGKVQAFLFYASGERMTVNAGVTSRPRRLEIQSACAQTEAALAEDRPEPETLYVVHPTMLSSEALAALRNFACHEIDGFQVCAAAPFDPSDVNDRRGASARAR
jgi:hypothetical protein